MGETKTASYKIIKDAGGTRYKFFCDLSGALVCTTKPYKADAPEEELQLAWEKKAKSILIPATNAEGLCWMPCSILRYTSVWNVLPSKRNQIIAKAAAKRSKTL